MRKEIVNLFLEVFQDKSLLIELGLSPIESDVFYHLLHGNSMKDIARKNNQSIRSIKRMKIKCIHLIPILIKRRINFFKASNLDVFNSKLMELDTILQGYFDYSYNSKNKKIRELNLSNRTVNALNASGIFRVNDVINLSYEELTQIRLIGKKAIIEIEAELSKHDIAFKNNIFTLIR